MKLTTRIAQSIPYSGPASAFGVVGRTMQAWFRMLNENGGIGGRKIELTSLDNGFQPPKALEASRKLVEELLPGKWTLTTKGKKAALGLQTAEKEELT